MLSVSSVPRPQLVTEKSFERAFAIELEKAGKKSWHQNHEHAGWPDRYVASGMWIEFKVLRSLGKDNGTSPTQKIKMNELHAAGDRVFYCARYGNFIICEAWHWIRDKNLKEFSQWHKTEIPRIIQQVILA